MSRLNEMTAGFEDRWAKAERYARGVVDHGMGEALRVYYVRYFPIGAALVIAAIVAGFWVIPGDGSVDRWSALGFGAALFGLIAAIGGLVYDAKRLKPTVELGAGLGALFPLSKSERAALQRQIRGKEPVPTEHLVVARAAAIQLRKQGATQLLVAPGYVLLLGGLNGSFVWFLVLSGMVLIGLTVWQAITFRQMGQFLARTSIEHR